MLCFKNFAKLCFVVRLNLINDIIKILVGKILDQAGFNDGASLFIECSDGVAASCLPITTIPLLNFCYLCVLDGSFLLLLAE